MKIKRIAIVIAIGLIVLLSCKVTILSASDDKSEIIQLARTWQQALKDNDTKKLWEISGEVVHQFNNNDYELYKKMVGDYTKGAVSGRRAEDNQLGKIIMITPNRAWVRFVSSPTILKGLYVVKEHVKWKTAYLATYLKVVSRDFHNLYQTIKKYYAKNKHLPDNLSMLVPNYIKILPQDPFSDENETYNYEIMEKDKQWRIYSVGIDSEDNSGLIEFKEKVPAGGIELQYSPGDIIQEGSITE